MKRRKAKKLAERVAVLEAATGVRADGADLDARVAALERAIRQHDRAEPDPTAEAAGGDRYAELIAAHVPAGERLAVVSEASVDGLAVDRRVVAFPEHGRASLPSGRFDQSVAAIAHLEAQRVLGTRFLFVPEPERAWVEARAELVGHLRGRYEIAVDEPGVGLLVDLGAERSRPPARMLAEVLDGLGGGDRYAPILDWTGLDLASTFSERNVFAPLDPEPATLPYLDHSVEVVVVADPRRLPEGRRVAAGAVVLVSEDPGGGLVVGDTEAIRGDDSQAPESVLIVVPTSDPADLWVEQVERAVAERPGVTVRAAADPPAIASEAEAEVVLICERGVLPLPGCIETMATTLSSAERVGGVAAKLLGADGSLAAAGAMVFADGSVAGIAAGLGEVSGPWHEYARPVCAATGVLAVRPSAARQAAADAGDGLTAFSAALWRAGCELRYQPDAWAVRALAAGAGNGAEERAVAEAWAPALPALAHRPASFDARVWRGLLAREDVEGSWR
jgi:hypothetical protein